MEKLILQCPKIVGEEPDLIERISNDFKNGYLTINDARDGKGCAWYLECYDDKTYREKIVRVSDLKVLETPEEKKENIPIYDPEDYEDSAEI